MGKISYIMLQKPFCFCRTVFLFLISLFRVEDRVVIFYPVADHDSPVLGRCYADDHLFNTGIYYLALAHGAAHGIRQKLICGGIPAHKVDGGTYHITSGGGDDGVGLGVDTAAKLVTLTGGDLQALTGAYAQIAAVSSASGGAVIAGGDDLIGAHDDGTVLASKAGGALQNGVCNIQIVILFTGAVIHSNSPEEIDF